MNRLVITLVVFAIWIAITMVGGALAAGDGGGLVDLVKNGIGWHFVLASVFLVAMTVAFGWRDVRLGNVRPGADLRILWLPLLFLAALLAIGVLAGLPPPQTVAFVLVNTMLVGFSEELMFRGILLRGLMSRFSPLMAMLVTSVLFGALHAMNVFITGHLVASLMQAMLALMSGVVFMAIVIRTGSLWPTIIYHGLWDFAVFLIAASPAKELPANVDSGPLMELVAISFVVPNFLYGVYLLRGTVRQTPRIV